MLDDEALAEYRAFAKSNFRNGGANLRVCLDSRQGIATVSEITFGNQFTHPQTCLNQPHIVPEM